MPLDPPHAPEPPRRPLVWLAACLGAGTWLGLAQAARGGWGGALVVLAAVACWLLAPLLWRAWRWSIPRWAPATLGLAFLRACLLGIAPAQVPALTELAAHGLRDEPVVGRWRAEGSRTGRIEPLRGAPDTPAHTLLYELDVSAPADGKAVAVLPGGSTVPWPRGPVVPPRTRTRRFAALAPVAADELISLDSCAGGLEAVAALRVLRGVVGERVAALEGPHASGLLRALATGTTKGLTHERVDLFVRTGTRHLLAISGWHVGLFAALLLALLLLLPARTRGGRAALLGQALLLTLFAVVAGGAKPVVRATLALLFLSFARRRGSVGIMPLRPDGLSFLGAAFTLECLLDPRGLSSLSLQLSYAATLGILLGLERLMALRPRERPPQRLDMPPSARLWRVLLVRTRALLCAPLAASGAAVLATLPLAWTAFGETAPAGIVITLAALPPFIFLSALSWIAAVCPWSGLTGLGELGARALYSVLELGDCLPGTPWVLPPRPLWAVALASGLAFMALRDRRAQRAACIAFGALLLPWSAAPSGLELHALDVGHGSALVLRAPGLEALVFDAGSRDRRRVAREALIPLLASWDVARPLVVLSHPDRDHASGLIRVRTRWPGLRWWGARPAHRSVRAAHDLGGLDITSGRVTLETTCPELSLALLRGREAPGNEGSRALEVAWKGRRLLLLGDAEEALEGLDVTPGPLELLLAPHHGSRAPALWPLLERAPPHEVWISASGRPPIARELSRRGITWRWTGRDGPLALHLP